jgi:hypothetical protein
MTRKTKQNMTQKNEKCNKTRTIIKNESKPFPPFLTRIAVSLRPKPIG